MTTEHRGAVTWNAELWGSLLWLVVGAFVVWSGHDLGVGTISDPGSGFLLFWAGLLMCGLSLWTAARAMVAGGPTLASLWVGTRWTKVLAVIACLAAYGMLFDILGFPLATLPLMVALLRIVDPVRWAIAIPLAVGSTAGSWWVLRRVLLIQLPSGIWDIG